MRGWVRHRFEVFRLVVLESRPFRLLLGFQVLVWTLHWLPPVPGTAFLVSVPWQGWALGWLAYLWLATLGYAAERKGRFDFTSMNFFRSYLDFIINEGGRLLARSESKDFHLMVGDWQRQAVEGIGIGLGARESEKFFQKMDAQASLTDAYQETREKGTNEPLCRVLVVNIEELRSIRAGLEAPELKAVELAPAARPKPAGRPDDAPKLKLIGASKAAVRRPARKRKR